MSKTCRRLCVCLSIIAEHCGACHDFDSLISVFLHRIFVGTGNIVVVLSSTDVPAIHVLTVPILFLFEHWLQSFPALHFMSSHIIGCCINLVLSTASLNDHHCCCLKGPQHAIKLDQFPVAVHTFALRIHEPHRLIV